MKVFLNSNFEIENISNESGDPIVRGSDKFNKLHIFVPTSTVNSYNTISPLYSVKRADGRVLGNYATITTHDNTEAFNGYYGWKGDFNPRDIAVAGALELTISFKMKKTAASVEMTKAVAKITLEVKEAVVVLDDVLVLGDGGVWTSLSESIAALTSNLGAKADKENSQQTIIAGTVKANSFKKNDVELATEAQVSEEATARQQADNALQTDINTRVKIVDIINALNDTSTNKPLSAYQGKLLKDAIDSINTLLHSDDTNLDELQEIVTYIKNNKTLIDGITSSKISYTDIVDNLTSELANKPLSAKQGYILKGFIDALQTAVNNRYTKSETDNLLDGKADKSTTYTKTQVDNLLDGKQDITIPAITIAGVEYTNLEAAISAINDYAETIEQLIGSISGTDTTIAARLIQLETSVGNLNSAWQTFTTGTSADNIINTLVEIQQELAKFNIITIDDTLSITQAQYDSINEHTIVVRNNVCYRYFEKSDNGYYVFTALTGGAEALELTIGPGLSINSIHTTPLEKTSRKVTTWSSTPNDTNYPSEKLVKDSLDSETSRATAQENKSLYHLGAFDIYSNGVVTRNGGKYVFTDFSSPMWTPTSNTYGFQLNIEGIISPRTVNDCVANVPIKTGDSAWGSQTVCFDPVNCRIYCPRDYNTPVVIQYKLASSYTEQVIENESILPLDSNMANKIRQDVVEGLNLFDGDGTYSENITLPLVEAYTYSISFVVNNGSGNSVQIYSSKTQGNRLIFSNLVVGNTYGDCLDVASDEKLIIVPNGNTISNIMLNKGSHPYPHNDYHARKHITDEEAALLKDEYKKSSNLWKNASSITKTGGGYVFDNYINQLKAGTYTFSFVFSGTTSQTQFIVKDVNDNILVNPLYDLVNGLNSITFTINSDSYYVSFYDNSAGTYSNIMLNEGSEAEPYSEHYGEIVHKKELPHLYLHHLKVESMDYTTFKFTILSPYSFTITDFSDLFFVLSTYTGGLNKKVVVGMVELEVNDTDHDRILFHEPEEADVDANTTDLEITDNKVALF